MTEELLQPQEPYKANVGMDRLELSAMIACLDEVGSYRELTPAERRTRDLFILAMTDINLQEFGSDGEPN